MDVGALTRKIERKGWKHESHQSGSAGPLYFRGFLGEIRSIGFGTRDSIWRLTETQGVVQPQYVAPESRMEAPKFAPQVKVPETVTSAPIGVV